MTMASMLLLFFRVTLSIYIYSLLHWILDVIFLMLKIEYSHDDARSTHVPGPSNQTAFSFEYDRLMTMKFYKDETRL